MNHHLYNEMFGKTVGKKINQDFSLKLNPRANNFTIAIPQPSKAQADTMFFQEKNVWEQRQVMCKGERREESEKMSLQSRAVQPSQKGGQANSKPEFKKKGRKDKLQIAKQSKGLVQPLQTLVSQKKHPDRKINISDLLKEMRHLQNHPLNINDKDDPDDWTKYIKKNCKSVQPNTDVPEPVLLQFDQRQEETNVNSKEIPSCKREQKVSMMMEQQTSLAQSQERAACQQPQIRASEAVVEVKVKKFVKKKQETSPVKKNQNKNQTNKLSLQREQTRQRLKPNKQSKVQPKQNKDKQPQPKCQSKQQRHHLIKKMVQDQLLSFEDIQKMLVRQQQTKEKQLQLEKKDAKDILFTNQKLKSLTNDLFRLDFHQLVNKSQISI